MKAARLHAINDFRIDKIEIPHPKGEEILVKVGACGICGSDIPRIFELGTSKQKYPLVIGHEFSGTVVAVGEKADQSLIGKRGAIFPCIPCRKCEMCLAGEYVMCEDYGYLGSRDDGGFAEYCLLPNAWHLVVSENENISDDAISMTEPCTVAQHAIRKGNVTAGQNVVIFGAGPIGIMAARWCKIFGAKPMLFDVVDEKVEFAIKHGEYVVNSVTNDVVETVKKFTGGRLADVVVEGTGVGSALGQCIEVCKSLGTIVLMGNPSRDTTITLKQHSMILRKELTLVGIWNSRYSDTPLNQWKCTVEMLDNGKMTVEDLITHRCTLEELPQLCKDIYERKITICKALYSSSK